MRAKAVVTIVTIGLVGVALWGGVIFAQVTTAALYSRLETIEGSQPAANEISKPAKPSEQSRSPRPLGTLKVLSGPVPCLEQECFGIEVTCPEVAAPAQAWLKVGAPTNPSRGTVLATTGGPGNRLYEEESPGAKGLLTEIRAAGFQTVQLQWLEGWLFATPGREEGHVRLACRSATVARWVYDNLHKASPTTAYGAIGNSGGAAQVSYMLTHYGLEDILSVVVPSAGPPMGRLDLSCFRDDPANKALWFPDVATRIIDGAFGFARDGSGPCSRGDISFREKFQQASVSFGDADYFYPRTLVGFVFGEEDSSTNATEMGLTYYNRLISAGSPWVRMDVLPKVTHDVKDSREGSRKILEILVNECRPRHARYQQNGR